ncbi:MAG: hypothetical protein SOT19_01640 [Muribaculaceae bacterium]|nr:hypothetical protein [Muribaculaceae bacterium]
MKQTTVIIAAALSTVCAAAQTQPTDSVPAQELHEIVIKASKVIRKSDMDVYHPSQSAVENSNNGMQLLDNLMIPTLSVNDALSSITAAGQQVQVRINGRTATIDNVRALLPETIRRVEWIDNPGLRYGGASYVLNFIVDNPTAGGSLQLSAAPALNVAFGNYMADVKLNFGRSQFEIGNRFKLTNKVKAHREYSETFTYPDGSSLTRDESPLGGSIDNTQNSLWASYNYVRPDTTVFIAEFGMWSNMRNKTRYNGLLSLSDGSDNISLTDMSGYEGSTPSLSLYLQQHFAHRQMLVVDFSTSLYIGKSFSDYIERNPVTADYLNNIHTNIHDRNQAYAIEADYIKKWNNSRLTAGASYRAKRNRSKYESLSGEVYHQRQDKVYFFAEYYQRFGHWTATAGIGAQYTDYLFRESDRGSHSWSARPQATITYSLNSNHNFRLNFTSWQSTPSLEETNVVAQQIDGFQWRVGNQNLKTANSYMLTFRYGFSLPRVNGTFGVRAFTSPNAITPLRYWEGDRLINSYENSRGLRNLSFFLAPQIEIVPEWLNLSGYLQYRMERMKGTGYAINHNGWSGNAQMQLSHWNFMLTAEYQYSQRDLWGETITSSEDVNIITLTYNWKNWQFGAGVIMPFGNYDQSSRSLNKWNRNEQHMRMNMRMPFVQIAWSPQWGRQKQSANKLINADASTDRSTAGGR